MKKRTFGMDTEQVIERFYVVALALETPHTEPTTFREIKNYLQCRSDTNDEQGWRKANESGSADRKDSDTNAPVREVGTQTADIGHGNKLFRPTKGLDTKLFFLLE